jgi:ribosomal protein S18 acetylase RimI-like enzyme
MTKIRPLENKDINFLWDMLYEAIYVEDPTKKGPREELLAIEGIAKYVKGFGEDINDKGFIAEDEFGNPVGAVWYRLFGIENKGYGFISEDTPELSIAIKPEGRGKGIGSKLMEALIAEAKKQGFNALSLSVDPTNAAARLYKRLGFIEIGMEGTSAVMKVNL